MRPRVNRLFASRTTCGTILGILLAALSASAQETARSIDERWIPEFAFTSGVMFGTQHASVSSDCRVPGSDPPTPTTCKPGVPEYGSQLRRGAIADENATTPYVGGVLSVQTPVLARWGRPRLFAAIELPYQFGIDRNVAQKDRPTGIEEPDNPEAGETLDDGALNGVGSRTRTEIKGLTFGAGAGAAVSFELLGRQFRVKTSADWLRMQVGVRGRIEHGICRVEGGISLCDVDGVQPPGAFAFTRIVTLKAHDSIWLDGVGPQLELEMDTGRFGPYRVSLFLGGGGYYFFGDRSVAFQAQRTLGPDPAGDAVDYHASFSFRASPWLYRAGLGLRFAWVGYD